MQVATQQIINYPFEYIEQFEPFGCYLITLFFFWENNVETEIDMMKERFAKLLLGEDMSGSGKGVCTALAISNAITNLCGRFLLLTLILFVRNS